LKASPKGPFSFAPWNYRANDYLMTDLIRMGNAQVLANVIRFPVDKVNRRWAGNSFCGFHRSLPHFDSDVAGNLSRDGRLSSFFGRPVYCSDMVSLQKLESLQRMHRLEPWISANSPCSWGQRVCGLYWSV